MPWPARLNHLSVKLLLAAALFMLLLLGTVVTAVNLGLTRVQEQSTQLSVTALSQQGRTQLQERVRLEATISDANLTKAANLTRIAADYLEAAIGTTDPTSWDAGAIKPYPDHSLQYDANPNRVSDLVIPGYVQLDDAQWERIAQSSVLDNVFPTLLAAAPDAIAIYYQETSMVFRYYPLIGVVDQLAGSPGLAPENARYLVEKSPAAPLNDPDRRTVWDPPYVDNAGQGLLITVNTPVYINNEFQGVVSIDLSLERLVTQLQTIQPTPGSYAFIVDGNGRLVAAAVNGIPRLVAQLEEPGANQLTDLLGVSLADSADANLAAVIQPMWQGQSGLAETTIGGEAVFLAYAPMPNLGWSLGVVTPLTELTAPADAVAAQTAVTATGILRLTVGLIAVFFLAALLGVYFTNRRLMRPVAELVKGTETITAGDLNVTIPVTTRDELGRLAQSFNRMTAGLRQARLTLHKQNNALLAEIAERRQAEINLQRTEELHRRELEARVADRTRELLTLLDVSHNLTLVMPLPELLQLILAQLNEVVAFSAAAIVIVEGEFLQQAAYRGASAEAAGPEARLPQHALGVIWDQLALGEPVVVGDLDEDTPAGSAYRALTSKGVGDAVFQAQSDYRAWAAVPLRLRDRTVGALVLQHQEPGRYVPERLDLAVAFANQAAIALENARLYEQAQSLAALEERQKLARELHDSVSQALYGIALGTRTARMLIARAEEQPLQQALREPLDYVLSLAEAGLAEMRALIFELRPESLATEGLVVALEKQTAALQARHHVQVDTAFMAEPDVPLPVKEALYRVSQEALHNIVKHAGAAHVEVSLSADSGRLALILRDDGHGFDADGQYPGHLGLKSMRERVERIGGSIAIDSGAGAGTTITVLIPAPPLSSPT